MQNLNQTALTTTQQATAATAFTSLESLFEPLAPDLTAEQRQTMPKINVDNRAFVKDASDILGLPAAATIIPSFIKKTDIDIDLVTFDQMDALIGRTKRLLTIMEDIRTVAGSEAYVSSLLVKRMVDAAAIAGLNGASELSRKLGERFAGQGGSGGSNGGGNGDGSGIPQNV